MAPISVLLTDTLLATRYVTLYLGDDTQCSYTVIITI